MSEYGPQGFNGVSLADRAVRQLGIEVANSQISLANANARLEEIVEVASQVNFDLWEQVQTVPVPPNESSAHSHTFVPIPGNYSVPEFQVDVVMRLLSLLSR